MASLVSSSSSNGVENSRRRDSRVGVLAGVRTCTPVEADTSQATEPLRAIVFVPAS
jgi:hypothetical protein